MDIAEVYTEWITTEPGNVLFNRIKTINIDIIPTVQASVCVEVTMGLPYKENSG
jgi:hypothetical protein